MKILFYILLAGFLFALLDWKIIELTRIAHPEWTAWMHSHERLYADTVFTAEYLLCAPAMAIKPVFYYAIVASQASNQQQEWVIHAPFPTLQGFYHLPVRGQDWTFVPWFWWITYWIPQIAIWIYFARRIIRRMKW